MPIPMPTRSPDPVLADQLTIVRGMLSTLESLTHAGQQYLTGKVISFVEDRAPVLLREMSGRSRRTFLELLTDLRHEHDRLAPDVTAVVRRGEHLIALLAGVA